MSVKTVASNRARPHPILTEMFILFIIRSFFIYMQQAAAHAYIVCGLINAILSYILCCSLYLIAIDMVPSSSSSASSIYRKFAARSHQKDIWSSIAGVQANDEPKGKKISRRSQTKRQPNEMNGSFRIADDALADEEEWYKFIAKKNSVNLNMTNLSTLIGGTSIDWHFFTVDDVWLIWRNSIE